MAKRADDKRHLEMLPIEEAATAAAAPRWLPEGHDPALEDAPWEALRYVVVDDVYEGDVLLIGYLWPAVTAAGTLYFGEDPRLAGLPEQSTGDSWRDSAPGMPLVFTGIHSPGDELVHEAASSDRDEGPEGAWMPRAQVQSFVDTARDGGDQIRPEVAGGHDLAPELHRPLRIGDTFAVVIVDHDQVDIVATRDEPPTEYVPFESADLIDITRQARSVAKAAQFSALSPPKAVQQLDEEIEANEAEARVWELDGDTEISVGGTSTQDLGDDPRDARPAV